ncbi:MAG: glycosyltransferase family 4 protein [Mucilaginibacter sp.]
MKRLAIITTHPIQYYAPVFKLLVARDNICIKVFYTLGMDSSRKNDPGFGRKISWDIPLMEGYDYEWVMNTSPNPGSANFKGIINPGLINSIKEWNPDAILVYGWAYDSHLKALRYFKNKIAVYFRGDSTLINENGRTKRALKYLFLKWVYHHVDRAFYPGTNNKAYFKKYGLKEKQLTFAPHAIDNERFETARKEEVNELRKSLNVTQNDILIVYAGKFEPVKNTELLLSAFIELKRPNVHLLLVGNGVNEQSLKQSAAQSEVANNIHFSDFKNQTYMPVIYQAADLFCLPSRSETWGLSVNEAMVCKTAILISDSCGCAVDLVKNEQNGIIFRSGSAADLLLGLQKLTENKELLKKYGLASASIIEPWNFLNIAKAIENVMTNETN